MEFLSLIIIGVLIIVVAAVFVGRKRKQLSKRDIAFVEKEWEQIRRHAERENGGEALMNADKMLDFVLRKKGIPGSFQEKMRRAALIFSDAQGVWDAHTLRNRCAHEAGFHPASADVRRSLSAFRRAFRDLDSRFSL